MPKVVFVAIDGTQRTIDANTGDSVMTTAVKNGVRGILAECGGSCTCGTCHVYVYDSYLPVVGPPGELEEEILDVAVTERRPNSRLSCQLKMSDDLDGLTVDIPPVQP